MKYLIHKKRLSLLTQYILVDKSSTVKVKVLGRGGFATPLKPIE